MFERFRNRKRRPLTGAPPVRRLKTYSAQSGYVYQYFYAGQRPYRSGPDGGTEFVFDVSADRKTSTEISVFVGDASARSWEAAHGRALIANERYAVAKLALFQAFDERPSPAEMKAAIHVRPADVEAILEQLGVD